LPVHRIPISLEDGVAPLVDLVADLEADNDEVVGVLSHANEWIVVTKTKRVRRETR
jgi:hypothetical protein